VGISPGHEILIYVRYTLLAAVICFVRASAQDSPPTPPSIEAQQRVLKSVTEFAQGYLDRLPNFTCTRTTQHFIGSAGTGEWQPEAKTDYELSYYEHDEHYKLLAVDGMPVKKIPSRIKSPGWMEMSGNFGWILKQLFDPKVHPHFEWKGWDSVRGRRALVFSYRIALAESHAVSTTCSTWLVFNNCREKTYGFHGLLYVDAESLDILRIMDIPDGLPPAYFQGVTSVDYGHIVVAGNEYLLPVADRIEATGGKALFRNDSTYTGYRRFVAESTLIP
jgi:hypothetical protein